MRKEKIIGIIFLLALTLVLVQAQRTTPGGGGGGGSGGGNLKTNANQFAPNVILTIMDGVALTNIHIHEIRDRNGNFSLRNTTNGAAGDGELDVYDGTAAGYKATARGGNDILSLGGGWGTTLLINSIHPTDRAASKIIRTDTSTNLAEVTIGNDLTFDGTTLAGSGTNVGPLTITAAFPGDQGGATFNATNAVGSVTFLAPGNFPVAISNYFNGSNFTVGWVWRVSTSNANVITWTSGPPVDMTLNTTTINNSGAITTATFTASSVSATGTGTNSLGTTSFTGSETNLVQSYTVGTLFGNSNILAQAGQSTTNAWLGGLWYQDYSVYTNHSTVGQFTNFATVNIPANMLTNNGDRIRGEWEGFFALGTNHLQIGLGSQTNFLDTGAQTNGAASSWSAWCKIDRTGNTAQRVTASISWNLGNGTPFFTTNIHANLAETNGIATQLKMAGRTLAGKAFGITNDSFRVYYEPGIH